MNSPQAFHWLIDLSNTNTCFPQYIIFALHVLSGLLSKDVIQPLTENKIGVYFFALCGMAIKYYTQGSCLTVAFPRSMKTKSNIRLAIEFEEYVLTSDWIDEFFNTSPYDLFRQQNARRPNQTEERLILEKFRAELRKVGQ